MVLSLCSRNARPQKALVGRAQLSQDHPASYEKRRKELEETS
jgi:hypothetical protein